MRRLLPLLSLTLVLAACAPEPSGPIAPIAKEQVAAAPALDASAARQAVVEFVDAYASSPTEGVGALSQVVAGTELVSWVRWLDVQNREFTGSIRASADVRDVEFIGSIQARQATGARVGLSASVTFEFAPEGADAFERARILDGPVTLLRTEAGTYKVIDLMRDGVPMSAGIQVFRDQSQTEGGVRVSLDSLFMFPPSWQFNVVIRNRGSRPLVLDPEVAGLYVESEGDFERLDAALTGSLAVVPGSAEAEGILAYPLQDSAEGRVLTLAYQRGGDVLRFEFPLEDLVTAVPPPPPTAETPAEDATT